MAVDGKLVDGKGTGNSAHVDLENRLAVSDSGVPPIHPINNTRVFRDFFKDSTGSSDMLVPAPTGFHDFYIESSPTADRYISTISFSIGDSGASLRKFGNITALINGVEFFYEDTVHGNVVIHDGLKSNFDFIRLCQGSPAFGTGSNAFRASNGAGSSEYYTPALDIQKVFGLKWGIMIPQGSTLRLVLRIKDRTDQIDEFNVVAYGIDRLK